MVLTTIDSAAYRATQVPFGPVHINCPFREPLDDHPKEWASTCLSGLDLWTSNTEPFTKYIKLDSFPARHEDNYDVTEVLHVIQNAKKGLLLIGAIHTEGEIWAALHLAKHLFWPVAADILSGLRLRRVLSSFPEIDDQFLFIDHLDHALLSDSVKNWAQPDVVLQVCLRGIPFLSFFFIELDKYLLKYYILHKQSSSELLQTSWGVQIYICSYIAGKE